MLRILLFLSGYCLKTEVFKQLQYKNRNFIHKESKYCNQSAAASLIFKTLRLLQNRVLKRRRFQTVKPIFLNEAVPKLRFLKQLFTPGENCLYLILYAAKNEQFSPRACFTGNGVSAPAGFWNKLKYELVPKLFDCALRARFWDRLLRFFRFSALQNREFYGCFPKN
ncbi:MAG: hypothetical protein LBH26_00835 [Treponema sp.]|jgi:hypothetical protein|nr:hypothetical protein [Treponema sp.]